MSINDQHVKVQLKKEQEQQKKESHERWQAMCPAKYEGAAGRGVPSAMHNLGLCYVYGRGTAKDRDVGEQWLQKAAAAGLAASYTELGVLALAELAFDKAAACLEKAVLLEPSAPARSRAQWELGNLYAQGQGVPRDLQRALELVEASAAPACLLSPVDQQARDQRIVELQAALRQDCPVPPEIGDKVVTVSLAGQVGFANDQDVVVKAKLKTLLSQLLAAFAAEKGVSVAVLRAFNHEGVRLKPALSLYENGVSDGDVIDIARDQDGGAACKIKQKCW